MRFRTRKVLVNLSTFIVLACSGLVIYFACTTNPSDLTPELSLTNSAGRIANGRLLRAVDPLDPKSPFWRHELQRPLYDPPVVPVVVPKPVPRPILVKLKGVILEGAKSKAFILSPDGKVALKKIGDQVSKDPADGVLAKIEASGIVIIRDHDEIHLQVESGN